MSLATLFARLFGEWRSVGKAHKIPEPRTDEGYSLQDHIRQGDYDIAAQLAPRPQDYVPERI